MVEEIHIKELIDEDMQEPSTYLIYDRQIQFGYESIRRNRKSSFEVLQADEKRRGSNIIKLSCFDNLLKDLYCVITLISKLFWVQLVL